MTTRLIPVLLALVMLSAGAAVAQVTQKRNTPSRLSEARICGKDVYPDLTITLAEIKRSDDILVTVKSVGECDAGASQLTMWIKPVNPDSSFKYYYDKVPIAALRSGQSIQLKLWWTSGTLGLFEKGDIKFTFTVDGTYKVKEEDEYNNIFELHP